MWLHLAPSAFRQRSLGWGILTGRAALRDLHEAPCSREAPLTRTGVAGVLLGLLCPVTGVSNEN